MGARFSAPVQTGRGAHPAPCAMGAGPFPGVMSGRGVTLTPHSLLVLQSCKNTRSDSKVMRLVPKKSFILFIQQLKYGHLQSTSLVPAHTFSSSAAIVCSIPGMQLE